MWFSDVGNSNRVHLQRGNEEYNTMMKLISSNPGIPSKLANRPPQEVDSSLQSDGPKPDKVEIGNDKTDDQGNGFADWLSSRYNPASVATRVATGFVVGATVANGGSWDSGAKLNAEIQAATSGLAQAGTGLIATGSLGLAAVGGGVAAAIGGAQGYAEGAVRSAVTVAVANHFGGSPVVGALFNAALSIL